MRELLREEISVGQDLSKEADRIVRMETDSVYNPALSTEEVADELGVSPEMAYELLDNAPRPSKKAVGDLHIWW